MGRKMRSDKRLGSVARDLGISEESFRNPDGRKTRKDKQLGTARKEYEKSKK